MGSSLRSTQETNRALLVFFVLPFALVCTTGQQVCSRIDCLLPPVGANQRLRFSTHHHAHGARSICGTLFSAGSLRPFHVIPCVSRSPCFVLAVASMQDLFLASCPLCVSGCAQTVTL
jgi:hypothetical protein